MGANDLDESINECLMFHGTSPEAAEGISDTNFRLPEDDQGAHGCLYGRGIYLAETHSKAHMYCKKPREDGAYAIFIVRAALGRVRVFTDYRPSNDFKQEVRSGQYDTVCGDRRKLYKD